MATYEIIFWRDVPAIVEARDETGTVTRPLSERFQMLIDSAAMQLGLDGAEVYIAQWRRGEREQRPGSAADVADAVVRELEDRFPAFISLAFSRP